MDAAYILVILAVVAAIAVMLVYRTTRARPDHPMAGAEDDATTASRGDAGQGSSRTLDRPDDAGS